MASVTSNPSATGPLANRPPGSLTLRIEPPSTWFELRLQELWKYRELLFFLVWRDVKVRYKQTAIGIAWVIIQPLLTMLVATLFFGRLAKLPSQGLPYSVFCFAALVPWTYFSTALVAATNVVVENQRVITKVYFPRLILPVSAALSGLVDFGIGFIVLLIFTFAHGIRPPGRWRCCLSSCCSPCSRFWVSAFGFQPSTRSIATSNTSRRFSSSSGRWPLPSIIPVPWFPNATAGCTA